MKKIFFASGLFVFISFAQAQITTTSPGLKPWKITKFGLTLGTDSDQIRDLGHEQLLSQVDGQLSFDPSMIDFAKQDLTSMICENPNIGLEIALSTPIKNTELRLGLLGMFNRVEYVSYFQNYKNAAGNTRLRELHIDSWSHEIALDVGLHYALPLGDVFRLYGGVGGNVGKSFGNTMSISGQNLQPIMSDNPSDEVIIDYTGHMNYEEYDMHNGLHSRLYGQLGAGLVLFKRVEVLYQLRLATGARWVPNADLLKGTTTHTSSFSLRWNLR